MVEQRTEPKMAVSAGDSGGGTISAPAKQATGGGRASPSAAAVDRRSRGDRSANPAATNGSRDDNASGGGCAGGGGSHARAVRNSARGSREEGPDAHTQIWRQDSRAASPHGTTETPLSPTSMVSDSPRRQGGFVRGPLSALSPLSLLSRIGRSRSRSRSRPPSPRNGQNDTCQSSANIKPAGRNGRRDKEEPGNTREVAGGVVGIIRSTGRLFTLDEGRGASSRTPAGIGNTRSNGEGDTLAEHLQTDDHARDGAEFSHDVASAATEWLASFEPRFMPCLVAEAGARANGAGREGAWRTAVAASTMAASGPETKDGMLPAAISRVLHEVSEQTCRMCGGVAVTRDCLMLLLSMLALLPLRSVA